MMKSKIVIAATICVFCLSAAHALEFSLAPFVQTGTGQASGDFFTARGAFYAELGASSFSSLGSSSPYYPTLLGGIGVDLRLSRGEFFLVTDPLSFIASVDIGAWGGAVAGSTAAGAPFASAAAGSLAVSLRASECFSFSLGSGTFALELGPFVGINAAYFVHESISGVTGTTWLAPSTQDLAFVGASLGSRYSFPVGPGRLSLGLFGDIGLTPLSSVDGTLGAQIVYPWRALCRIGYELPLSAKKAAR